MNGFRYTDVLFCEYIVKPPSRLLGIELSISSWVLASIILDTFHGALNPGVLYIEHNLIIIISVALVVK